MRRATRRWTVLCCRDRGCSCTDVHVRSVSELYWLDVFGCSSEKHLERSVRIYRIALERSKQCVTSNMAAVTRHLAAALNEYGVSLMQKAEKSIDEGKHCRASIKIESNVESDARRAFIEATNCRLLRHISRKTDERQDDDCEKLASVRRVHRALPCCGRHKR